MIQIVIDLGFGDAGKGLCVDYLAAQAPQDSLVVRFSGGHQIGHTVVFRGRQHTFSNFGAGSFRGVPTYYSEHCTVFPPAMLVESQALDPLQPRVWLHPHCMICTPFDLAYNRAIESLRRHGSCGVGFGATVERHAKGICLFAKDLENAWVLAQKLKAVRNHYQALVQVDQTLMALYEREADALEDSHYIAACDQAKSLCQITQLPALASRYTRLIFEGSQGILLDQRHGIFPHVTPSNTTSQNAFELLRQLPSQPVEIYYVTRCYQTRHGRGPMSSSMPVELINNANEANSHNPYQGEFRCARLDPELLHYALASDQTFHTGFSVSQNLLVTCLDQLPGFKWDVLENFISVAGFERVLGSYGPSAADVVEVPREHFQLAPLGTLSATAKKSGQAL